MNTTEQRLSFVHISETQLRIWCRAALDLCSLSEADKSTVIDALVSSNLRGIDTHGVNLLPQYIRRHLTITQKQVQVTNDMPAVCHIDGGDNMGPPVAMLAMQKAIEKAEKMGIGLAIATSSNHFGATGYYTMCAAERGYIGFLTTLALATMPPWGGADAFLGNNPFSVRRRGGCWGK